MAHYTMCSKEAQEVAKAVAMATVNGFESGLAVWFFTAQTAKEALKEVRELQKSYS